LCYDGRAIVREDKLNSKRKGDFTVSGPGIDRPAEGEGPGLSAATTFANNATRAGRDETFYVRCPNGNVVGRAEADGQGGVSIYGRSGA
jgi:hypothetical protein